MLPTREIIELVAEFITQHQLPNVVVDPVIRSTSGYDLIDDVATTALIEKLLPLAEKLDISMNIENIFFNGYLMTPMEMAARIWP